MSTLFGKAQSQQNRQAQPTPDLGFDPSTGALDPGPLGGFLASAFSSIPEFVGAPPTASAEAFRVKHPWAGFASQVLPTIVPYVGAYKLSQIPKMAAALETTTAKIAGDAVLHPIRTGAVREVVRYAPLEAARLATGAVAYPENLDGLFADVVISEALAGGLGGIGGLFRLSGAGPKAQGLAVQGADITAAPTSQLQLLRKGNAPVDPAIGREAAEAMLVDDVLSETSAQKGLTKQRLPTVHALDNGSPNDVAELNNFFHLTRGSEPVENDMLTQLLKEGAEDNIATLNAGGQTQLLEKLNTTLGTAFGNVADVAENTFFPRLNTAVGKRGAEKLARLADSPAMLKVADNVWMGREAENGLHVMGIRLPAPQAEPVLNAAGKPKRAPKGYGPGGMIRPGDQMLVFKTNNPGAFVPKLQSMVEQNYSAWSGWRQAFQEPLWAATAAGRKESQLLKLMNPQDFKDLHRFSRATWVSKMSERVTKSALGEANLTDSVMGRQLAENLYDIVAPTMFKQGKNALYARFLSTMQLRMRTAHEELNKMFFGKATLKGNIWQHLKGHSLEGDSELGSFAKNFMSIPDEELPIFYKAGSTQTPFSQLAKLQKEGAVSQVTVDAIRNMQELGKRFNLSAVLPELEAAGKSAEFKLVEGYVMPIPRLGDYFQTVLDEAGKPIHLVTGKNVLQANRQANAIVKEAQAQGKNWSTDKASLFTATEAAPDVIDDLFKESMLRAGAGADNLRIIEDAVKKLNYVSHPSARRTIPLGAKAPKSMGVERSDLSQVIELPDRRELLKQIYSHYEKHARYATLMGWSERWGGELQRFHKYEPKLFEDLMRKRNQNLGYEGKVTNAMNEALQVIPGMGSKPATKMAQSLNKLMYNFNLAWANPTFAVLNALTPIMTVLPQIAYTLRAGDQRIARMYNVMPAYGANGPRGVIAQLSPLKLLWQGVRTLGKPDDEFRAMFTRLVDDGSLQAQTDMFLGAGAEGPSGIRDAFKRGDYWDAFDQSASWMARKSEEFSRAVSASTGYHLGKDVMGLTDEALEHFTRRFVETTNYMYGVTDRPRIFTGPLGSVFGLFKNWQMHYLGMMTNYAGLAWKENVWSPLLWQHGGALALGGLGATGLVNVADGLTNWFADEPHSYNWMLKNWPEAADNVFYGLPSFAGLSLQRSATIPGTDVRNDISTLGNIVIWERAKQLGKAAGGAIDSWQATGMNPLADPNVRDQMLSALTPRAVARAFSSVEGDYVKSMQTGYPQVRELSPVTKMLYGMGLNQLEVDRQQQMGRQLYADQAAQRELITGLGSAYAQATLAGDVGEAEQVIQRSVLMGLPLDSVMQSATNFLRREQQSDSLSRFDAQRRAEAMMLLQQGR